MIIFWRKFTFLLLFSLVVSSVFGQDQILKFKSGDYILKESLDTIVFNNASAIDGQNFYIVQFDAIPTKTEKEQLKLLGVHLLNYIPNNAFYVSITQNIDPQVLPNGAKFYEIKSAYK